MWIFSNFDFGGHEPRQNHLRDKGFSVKPQKEMTSSLGHRGRVFF